MLPPSIKDVVQGEFIEPRNYGSRCITGRELNQPTRFGLISRVPIVRWTVGGMLSDLLPTDANSALLAIGIYSICERWGRVSGGACGD